jgi:hypothetical protein
VMSDGTKYFRLSMSTIWEPETFSTITWESREVGCWGCSSVADHFSSLHKVLTLIPTIQINI